MFMSLSNPKLATRRRIVRRIGAPTFSRAWIIGVAGLLTLWLMPTAPAAAQKIERCYVGQRVQTPGGRVGSVVSVKGAGCVVHRDGDPVAMTDTWGAFMLKPVAGSPVRNPPPQRSLPSGEYACYGSGQRVLAGLGFKLLPSGKYTDLEGRSAGQFAYVGETIVFRGGHLGGQVGRNIKDNGFVLGAMASCQKW